MKAMRKNKLPHRSRKVLCDLETPHASTLGTSPTWALNKRGNENKPNRTNLSRLKNGISIIFLHMCYSIKRKALGVAKWTVFLFDSHTFLWFMKRKKKSQLRWRFKYIVSSLAKEFALNRPFPRCFQLLTGASWRKSVTTTGKTPYNQ